MTIKEAVISELGFQPGNKDVVDKAIIDQGLTGSNSYNVSDSAGVKTCALAVCRILLTTADVTSSAGGVVSNSIKYDRQAVLSRIRQLEIDLGFVTVPVATVRSVNVW